MRKTAVLITLFALGLSSLVLVSRDSVAQEEPASALVCPAGWDLDGELCVIDDGPQCPDTGLYLGAGVCAIFPAPLTELTCPAGSSVASVIDSCIVAFGDPDAPNPCPEFFAWDGLDCVRDAGPRPGPTCPDGFSPDDSLGGICARFEPADQMPESCPEGARGEVDACYILVARGPVPLPSCGEGEIVLGGECFILGDPPVPAPGECPAAADIVQDGCYRVVEPVDGECPNGSARTPAEGDPFECRQPVPLISPGFVCPQEGFSLVNGTCIRPADPVEPVTVGPFPCEGDTIDFGDLCLVIGAEPIDGVCEAGFRLLDQTTCVITADHIVVLGGAVCPIGSFEDADGNCRRPVANAAGAYFCPDPAAALNGRNCVFTAPFDLGVCEVGIAVDDRCIEITGGPFPAECGDADEPPIGSICAEISPLSQVECPPGSFDIGAGGGCYGEVPAACEDAVDGRCLRFVEPVVRGQISGKVRSLLDGSPIFGVQVCARNDFLALESCSFSQADGTYYLPPLPPGNYQLRTKDFSQRWADGCFGIGDCAEPAWVGLGLDMERDELSIWLDPTGIVPLPTATPTPTPTVRGSVTPTPTPTVHGSVTPTPTPEGPTPTPIPTPTATPTPDGPTATPTPTPGGPTPTPTVSPTSTPVPTSTPLPGTPTPTPTSTATVPIGDAPFLAGRVVTNNGPVDGVQVCADPLASFFAPVCVTSGPNGIFLLEGLLSSNYYVVADGGLACVGENSSCDTPRLFGVTPSTAIGDLSISVPPRLGPPPIDCPDGFEFDGVDGCVRYEDPIDANGAVCPAGARGIGLDCFIYVSKGPSGAGDCAEGELAGQVCVLEGEAPVQGPDGGVALCQPGFALVNGRCVVFLAPFYAAPSCPVGSAETIDRQCVKPVASLSVPAGTLDCLNDAAVLDGGTCVIRYPDLPEPYEACPLDYVEDDQLQACVRYESAAVVETTRCPDEAFGVAGACFEFVAKGPRPEPLAAPQCPINSFERADGNCVRPVDDVDGTPGERYCADPIAVLRNDACLVIASRVGVVPSFPAPLCDAAYSFDDSLQACGRFAPAIDGACLDAASFLNGNSCVWVAAPWIPRAVPPPGCPEGYSIDSSLGGVCARFEPAVDDGNGNLSCSDGGMLVGSSCIFTTGIVFSPPESDADCAARNIDFPYFNPGDGLCYANPINVVV